MKIWSWPVPLDLVGYRSSQDSRVGYDDNPDVVKVLRSPDQSAADVAFYVLFVAEDVALVGSPLQSRVH